MLLKSADFFINLKQGGQKKQRYS